MTKPPRENDFQRQVVRELRELLPGCLVLKNDSSYIQGIPDLSVLSGECWAFIEIKRSADEPYRPNQEYYLEKAKNESMSWTLYPENKKEVFDEIQRSFAARGCTRIPGAE